MKNHPIYFFILMLFLTACSIEPQPINYGAEACNYCKMNIVDNQHAAQFLTSKGKCYKFDAIECMLNHMKDFDEAPIEMSLICDYSNPGKLIDASSATFLISQHIPSPMGSFLSGFSSEKAAKNIQNEATGELFTWEQLQAKFEN